MDRWQAMWNWFHRALAVPVDARRAWLDAQALAPELRADLDRLVEAAMQDETPLDRPPLRLPDDELRPGQRIGAWAVVRHIGSGGMGDVYLVERADGAFERRCALKLMAGLGPADSMAARFAIERRALAGLNHPLIARLLDAGSTDDGRSWILMEWVDGEPLTRFCNGRDLGQAARLALFVRICEAVAHAHGRLVVHGDLKPGNILVEADGRPRLLDFGVAQLLGKAQPQGCGGPVGLTLGYAAPEAIGDQPSGIAGDVFSLGAVLYELLAGEPAFRFESHDLDHVLDRLGRPPTRRGYDTGLARDIRWIIDRALEPEPDNRYPDVPSMAADIRAVRDRRPPAVAPRAPGYRMIRFGQRNWRWLGAAACAGAVIVSLSIGLVVEADRAREAERASYAARADAEQVADFLARLFESSDPTANAGADLSAREILERGRNRLDSGAPMTAARRIRLVLVLGRVYANLGDHPAAVTLAREALDLAQKTGDGEGRLDALLLLARAHQLAGHDDQALEALARAAPAIRSDRADPDSAFRFAVLRGVSNQRMGRLAAAGADFRHAMAIARSAERPSWLAEASLRIGSWYWLDGDTAEALDQYRRALGARLRQQSPDAVEVATARDAYASALYALGRLEQARIEFARAAGTRLRVLGDAHPKTASSFSHLGAVLYDMGRDDEALQALDRALAIFDRAFDTDNPAMTGALNNYGLVLRRLGRLDEARDLFDRALSVNRATYGEAHRNVATNYNNLGLIAEDAGDPGRALDYFARAERVLRQVHGPDHAARAFALTNAGRVLLARGRLEDAAQSLQRALTLRQRHLGAEHDDTLETLQWLAVHACLAGRDEDAMRELERVRDRRARRLGSDSASVVETETLIGACTGRSAPPALVDAPMGLGRSTLEIARRLASNAPAARHSPNALARDG